jgi:hypothetical protein
MFATDGEQLLHGLGGDRLIGAVADRLAAYRNRPANLVKAEASTTATSGHRPELIEVASASHPEDVALRLAVKAIVSAPWTIEVAAFALGQVGAQTNSPRSPWRMR